MHVVCTDSAGRCAGIQGAFDEWVGQAIYEPGSTFTLWVTGPDRYAFRHPFVACIPASWGPNVMETKASFLRAAREQIEMAHSLDSPEFILPEGCTPLGPATAGTHTLRVLAGTAPSPSVAWKPIADSTTANLGKLHMAVLCDRSNSMRDSCNEDDLMRAFDVWLTDGFAVTGGTFTVYLIGNSYDTAKQIFSVIVPDYSLGQKAVFLLSARHELSKVLKVATAEPSSAVAEAISVAVSGLCERKGRHQLIILSDMRQYTPGRWNFEKAVPAAAQFIAFLRHEDLFVDLHGISVMACGLHSQRGQGAGPYSAKLAAQLRDTWSGVFRAMGATEIEMITGRFSEVASTL